MRIGIDARLINETGVGRYIRNLLEELSAIDTANTFVVFLRKDAYEAFRLPNSRWEKRIADVHWHTIKEQIVLPKLFKKAHLDLVHVPYFTVPLFSSIPVIVTIHDLTVLHFKTGKATTLPYVFYMLKRIGYHAVLRLGLLKARHILTVSETVKKDIIKSLGIRENKISVTYEGVDKKLVQLKKKASSPIFPNQKYLLYVGNAYPHKNLTVLLSAFQKLKQKEEGTMFKLVFVGSDTFFYKKLKNEAEALSCRNDIRFTGSFQDEQLTSIYKHAYAFIFPSLAEGFGLPALEAFELGCPVICSDIPVFHEILNGAATYFNPHDSESLVDAILHMNKQPQQTIDLVLSKYSWHEMAKQTLLIYEKIL